MISKQQAEARVRDAKSFYDAFVRNKYFMPPLKDALLSNRFLLGLRNGQYWLPKAGEVGRGCCADPPFKQEIADELNAALLRHPHNNGAEFAKALRATAEEIKSRPANRQWMLDFLFTLERGHRYFAKDYVRPRPDSDAAASQNPEQEISDRDGFFAGLPDYKGASKRARINFNAPSTAE